MIDFDKMTPHEKACYLVKRSRLEDSLSFQVNECIYVIWYWLDHPVMFDIFKKEEDGSYFCEEVFRCAESLEKWLVDLFGDNKNIFIV